MIQIQGIFNGIRLWRETEREEEDLMLDTLVWGGLSNSLNDYGNYTVE